MRARICTAAFVMTTAGCFPSLPPPTVRETSLPPAESYQKLCDSGLKRAEFLVHQESPLSGIVECGPDNAAIVLFNSFQLRVRTIRISRTGTLRDENSFLSPNEDSAELLVSEIQTALTSTEPHTGDPHIRITAREPRLAAESR